LRLLQSLTVARRPCFVVACSTTPLVRFLAPAALSSVSSPLRLALRLARARVYLTRFVPSSGFLTLSTACSSTCLPGLVSCRCALGVPRPTELFPRPEP
jgi:hypothetical protein